jgi:D-alanine-D-alanine ligase
MTTHSSQRPTVLVLMGGPDAEREVSICSGTEVAAALRQSGRFNVVEQIIDKPTFIETPALTTGANVIFPVLHGHWGEGGPLQDLLEQVGLPYVGSKPQAARLAMDKLITKSLLSELGVPTPPSRQLMPDDECDLAPPLVLKPVDDGSSVDLRICRTTAEVAKARYELHPKRGRLMAERYIKGREITVGIVFDQPLPLIEIVPGVEFYDYEAKYTRDDTKYIIDPPLAADVRDQCIRIAMSAFQRLGCRDISRVDIMLDSDSQPWFLEINTMPGFTTHSLVPMAARGTGLEMPEVCARLVERAMSRGNSKLSGRETKSSQRAKPQAAARR